MAEIHVERKPRRNVVGWVVGLVVLLVLAAAAWYFLLGPGQTYLDRGGDVTTVPVAPSTGPPP